MDRESTSDDANRARPVSRRAVLRGATGGLATVVGPAAGRTAAVRDGRCTYRDSSGPLDVLAAGGRGTVSRLFADAADRSPRESAVETTRVFNRNGDVLADYADTYLESRRRDRFDSIRIRFTGRRADDAVRYVVSDVDPTTNTILGTRMRRGTDRPVRGWVRLEGLATANAPDELERFVDCYAADGRPVSRGYVAHLIGRYGPDVRSSLLPGR